MKSCPPAADNFNSCSFVSSSRALASVKTEQSEMHYDMVIELKESLTWIALELGAFWFQLRLCMGEQTMVKNDST